VSRLEQEAGGRVFLEQPEVVTTLLVSSVRLLKEHPDLARKFFAAHAELTTWINAHGAEARTIVCSGLSSDMHRAFSAGLVESAWRRLHFTADLKPDQIAGLVEDAQGVGFLPNAIPLDRMFSGKP
jgi:NitT/TauT family transport system substrate-binding protein